MLDEVGNLIDGLSLENSATLINSATMRAATTFETQGKRKFSRLACSSGGVLWL